MRPDHVWGRIVEELGAEDPLSTQSLLGCSESSWKVRRRRAVQIMEAQPVRFQGEAKILSGPFKWYFELRTIKVKHLRPNES